MTILQVKERAISKLSTIPGVVGVGIQKGQIAVYIKKITAVTLAAIPMSIEGYDVIIIELGEIVLLQDRRVKWRPAPGGVSIGHYAITAGTLGAVVKDNLTGKRVILSNNHILANRDSVQESNASKGDPIYQPGRADGGSSADTIAKLERWVKWDEGTEMLVDCAIAMPINDSDVKNEILEIGIPKGIGNADVDMAVRYSGRTTGLATGTITDVNFTIFIGNFTWKDQILVTGIPPIGQGGDSGSAVVDVNNNLVGLLFAGALNPPFYFYVANKMTNVANLLNIGVPGVPEDEEPPTPPSEPEVTINYKIDFTNTGIQTDVICGFSIIHQEKGYEYDLPWWIIWSVPNGQGYSIPYSYKISIPAGEYLAKARAWLNYSGGTKVNDVIDDQTGKIIGAVYTGGILTNWIDEITQTFTIEPGISAQIINVNFSFG